jgi:hypothetical protein
MKQKSIVEVYMDDGRVFSYFVSNSMKGREHASKIISTGYRHTEDSNLEWYPPHRIDKVKVTGGGESTKYKDNIRAT